MASETRPSVAIVTGGAGGIGRAFVHMLLRRGYHVLLADMRGSSAAAREAAAHVGGGVVCAGVDTDVTDRAQLETMFRAGASMGTIRVVCNNAGIARPMMEDVDAQVGINLIAVIRGTARAIEYMQEHGGGLIVNTASVAGLGPVDLTPVYAASKAGVVNFTRSLGWMRDASGVRVVAVCPNFTDTAMVTSQLEEPAFRSVVAAQRGGLMKPEQVADALALALDDTQLAGEAILVTPEKGARVYAFRRGGASSNDATDRPRPRL